jgi:hypothetical protein
MMVGSSSIALLLLLYQKDIENGGPENGYRFVYPSSYRVLRKITSLKIGMALIKQLDPALVEKLDILSFSQKSGANPPLAVY